MMKRVMLIPMVLLVMVIAVTTAMVQAAETNFSASLLTADNVDCKKCHTDTPHIIHAQKTTASCENCHGDKLSIAIPRCTKCHNGPIHKVHAGKIEKGCEYCHKTVGQVHINLTSDTVCSHCHKDLVEVHGESQSCAKCHKTPPEIVKPLKAEGMILVCQNCHPATSVATIHGSETEKQGCYNCHKGASKLNGSEIPHQIHKDKASCKQCHEENSRVIVPQCPKCHKTDELHAFNKIGKLTAQSGLSCTTCHADISKAAGTPTKTDIPVNTEINNLTEIKETGITPESQEKEEKGPMKTPGFEIVPGIAILYIVTRKINK
jgi:hypothetical protein